IYFKRGTWWVYENSLTQARDCVYVTRTDTAFARVKHQKSKDGDPYYHYVDYTAFQSFMYSTYNKCNFQINDFAGVGTGSFDYDLQKSYSCNLPHNYTSTVIVFNYPFIKEYGVNMKYDSLTVKNKTYYNVVVFENTRESDHSLIPMNDRNYNGASKLKYYWAKNYGIIKTEFNTYNLNTKQNHYTYWDLIKSNIIQ
ncbi:MAG: hypothetical protein Q8K70_00955, partial [Bacteroidota bacterium]|nr:hypothetical protein [Bacteroidota bacterium]